MGSIILSLAEL